jgi:hypothetical protein
MRTHEPTTTSEDTGSDRNNGGGGIARGPVERRAASGGAYIERFERGDTTKRAVGLWRDAERLRARSAVAVAARSQRGGNRTLTTQHARHCR